jgi:pyruvate dehydrogenase E2 component (dihydrolipoamide acetyltransferase)
MARNMARAACLVPQAWIELRADVTALEAARRALRRAQPQASAPLTLTAVLCKALARALERHPRFNAVLDVAAGEVIYRDYVNIGVAVDAGHGLLVPVIRNVPALSTLEVAAELARLSAAARAGKLPPAAMTGAGITLTNLGSFGISGMQPIVSWPEVAIVGVAGVESRLGEQDGRIATRLELPLALGFDHRLIDGGSAARFVQSIAAGLARPDDLLPPPAHVA